MSSEADGEEDDGWWDDRDTDEEPEQQAPWRDGVHQGFVNVLERRQDYWNEDAILADRPRPPHLKEISSLASWTVSTHKPGCGVTALRHPSPMQFWQSDGPQPHTLNIHFFKMVAIAHLRLYVDASIDESYTPTKMELWAGTGHHDLQLVTELEPKDPRGWIDVDLSDAGGPSVLKPGEDVEDDENNDETLDDLQGEDGTAADIRAAQVARRTRRAVEHKWRRIGTGPTLRCFLVQLRIIENHQNGKDTHLRGLQIFARDETYVFGRNRRRSGVANVLEQALDLGQGRKGVQKPTRGSKGVIDVLDDEGQNSETPSMVARRDRREGRRPRLREPDFMAQLESSLGEHELR